MPTPDHILTTTQRDEATNAATVQLLLEVIVTTEMTAQEIDLLVAVARTSLRLSIPINH